MKKIMLAVALAVFGAFMVLAEDDSELSFRQIRRQAVNPERADSIKSVRAVYYFKDTDSKEAVFMIRAKKDNKIRIDFLVGGGLYTTVQNGRDFWNYEPGEGLTSLSDSDAFEFMQVASFLALPFSTQEVFTKLVHVGEDKMKNGIERDIYDMKTTDGSKVSYKVFFEKKTKLLRRVERTAADGKVAVVLFSKYKDFNGIKVPCNMFISNVRGSFVRRVATVDWNIEIDDSLFDPKKVMNVKDRDLILLKNLPGEQAEVDNQKVDRNQAKIEKLEREIRILKLEIADTEKGLAQREHVATKQFDTVAGLSSITGSSHSRRNFWGWSSSSYDGAANRDSRNRRSVINSVGASLDKVVTEYKRLNKKLLEQRIKLGDKEVQLEKLKNKAKKEAEEEREEVEE